jgi:hypothetical protein
MQVIWSTQLEGIANAVNRLGKANPNRAIRLAAGCAYRRLLNAAHCHLAAQGVAGEIKGAKVPADFEEAYSIVRSASRQFETEWAGSSHKVYVDAFLSYLGDAIIALLEISRLAELCAESGIIPLVHRGAARRAAVKLCLTPEEIFDNLMQRGILQQ